MGVLTARSPRRRSWRPVRRSELLIIVAIELVGGLFVWWLISATR